MMRSAHTNDNWKEWSYQGETVLIPGDCELSDDGNGGYYVYPCGDTSCETERTYAGKWFYFDNIMRTEEFDEEDADPLDNAEDCQVVSDETISYYKGVIEKYKDSNKAVTIAPAYFALGDAANIPGPNIKDPKGIRSLSEWYMAPLLYPDYVHAVFEEQVTRSIKSFEKCYDTFGNDIDVMYICGTDFGTQRGPFVNPDVFKEFYLPYYKNERMDSRAYGMEDFETQLRRYLPDTPLLIKAALMQSIRFSAPQRGWIRRP